MPIQAAHTSSKRFRAAPDICPGGLFGGCPGTYSDNRPGRRLTNNCFDAHLRHAFIATVIFRGTGRFG
jgi:hypothetical protein